MNNSHRRLNLVIYLPGYCGHFLQFLFGLDPQTWNLCRGYPRHQYYTFKHLHQRYGTWLGHHVFHDHRFGFSYEKVPEFLASDHPLAVIAIHPTYYQDIQALVNHHRNSGTVDVRFYSVEIVDSVLRHQLVDLFWQRQLPATSNFSSELESLAQLQSQYTFESTPIQLDRIIDSATFDSEYTSICASMGVSPQASAREFYSDWALERGLVTRS